MADSWGIRLDSISVFGQPPSWSTANKDSTVATACDSAVQFLHVALEQVDMVRSAEDIMAYKLKSV